MEWFPEKLATIPEHLRPGLQRYIEQGIEPGSGLMSILMDKPLSLVLADCDDDTVAGLRSIVKFLYNNAPGSSWGSRAHVEAWMEAGGIQGRPE